MMKMKSGWMCRANMLLVSLIVAGVFTGCAPVDVAPAVVEAAPMMAQAIEAGASVGTMEMLQGMQMAMQDGSGAFIMQSADAQSFLMAWPKGSAWEFALLSRDGLPINGIKLNVFSFSDLVKQLEAIGWVYVSPEMAATVLPAAVMDVMLFGLNAMPSIFVLPAIVVPEEFGPVLEEIPT